MGRRQNKRRRPFVIEYRWLAEEFPCGFRSFLQTDWSVWRRYRTADDRDAALRALSGKEGRSRFPTRSFRAAE